MRREEWIKAGYQSAKKLIQPSPCMTVAGHIYYLPNISPLRMINTEVEVFYKDEDAEHVIIKVGNEYFKVLQGSAETLTERRRRKGEKRCYQEPIGEEE